MLICNKCKFENSDIAKFCKKCGWNLAIKICPNCHEGNDQDAQFCQDCGSSLVALSSVENKIKEEKRKSSKNPETVKQKENNEPTHNFTPAQKPKKSQNLSEGTKRIVLIFCMIGSICLCIGYFMNLVGWPSTPSTVGTEYSLSQEGDIDYINFLNQSYEDYRTAYGKMVNSSGSGEDVYLYYTTAQEIADSVAQKNFPSSLTRLQTNLIQGIKFQSQGVGCGSNKKLCKNDVDWILLPIIGKYFLDNFITELKMIEKSESSLNVNQTANVFPTIEYQVDQTLQAIPPTLTPLPTKSDYCENNIEGKWINRYFGSTTMLFMPNGKLTIWVKPPYSNMMVFDCEYLCQSEEVIVACNDNRAPKTYKFIDGGLQGQGLIFLKTK
jgi:hypothetical protein